MGQSDTHRIHRDRALAVLSDDYLAFLFIVTDEKIFRVDALNVVFLRRCHIGLSCWIEVMDGFARGEGTGELGYNEAPFIPLSHPNKSKGLHRSCRTLVLSRFCSDTAKVLCQIIQHCRKSRHSRQSFAGTKAMDRQPSFWRTGTEFTTTDAAAEIKCPVSKKMGRLSIQ
jgi:hypothetical protein